MVGSGGRVEASIASPAALAGIDTARLPRLDEDGPVASRRG